MPLQDLLERDQTRWISTEPVAEYDRSRVADHAGRWMRLFWIVPILGMVFLVADRWLTYWTAPKEPLRIAINPWPGYAFAMLADELGYFQEEGVDVRLVEFRSLATARRAFERRQVDGFFGSLVEVLHAHEHSDRAPRVALIADYSKGADQIVAQSSIGSMSDLRGKTVAVEAGTLSLYLVSRGLERVGLTLDDLNLRLASVGEMPQLLRDRSVDAVVVYPPSSFEIAQHGDARTIYSSAEIPGEILDLLAFSEDTCRLRRRDVEACLLGYARAQDYAARHPHDAARRMGRLLGMSPDAFRQSIEHEIHVVSASKCRQMFAERQELVRHVQRVVQVLLQTKELTRPVEPSSIIDRREEL